MKKLILVICLIFTTKLCFSTSVILYSSEESIRRSNLIVEAKVVDIEKSIDDYCHYITVKVIDMIIGNCPEYIKLKRSLNIMSK
jgi:hypothetical protein